MASGLASRLDCVVMGKEFALDYGQRLIARQDSRRQFLENLSRGLRKLKRDQEAPHEFAVIRGAGAIVNVLEAR